MDLLIKPVTKPETLRSQCLVVPVFQNKQLSQSAKHLDKHSNRLISRLCDRGDIDGKTGSALLLPVCDGVKSERILLVGAGKAGKLNQKDAQKLIDKVLAQLEKLNIKDACLLFEDIQIEGSDTAWFAKKLSQQAGLSQYRYSKTLSNPKPVSPLKKITVSGKNATAIRQAADQGKAIAMGMNTARELGNFPANICNPAYLASQARSLARKHKRVSTSILEEKKMHELGMGALLSVTAGTEAPAKLIVMQYQGAKKSDKPHVLVGKGITFDSGGISLKPGAKMDEMKYDMCGAASVMGTMTALAELELPINVVAIIAAAENLPSGKATKPGDVVTSMSGQTIEVLNTDAEGRLVLCDALTYAAKFKPQSMIDIATLTGACVVALGSHATGLYSNQDDFARELLDAGETANDRAWQMPLWDEYQLQLDSNFADIANIGGPGGGSITAACFLSRFTKDQRWAHLDIAGTAWNSGASKGATGRPVALLTQYLINQCSK